MAHIANLSGESSPKLKIDLLAHQVVLLQEGPHHHVGEPEVVAGDGRDGLRDER